MSEPTVFFHQASDSVFKEINSRQADYGLSSRAGRMNQPDHNSFLASKVAYAIVKSGTGEDQKQIGFPKSGGFQSQYNTSKPHSIVPRAGLIDVSVRHDGEFGTLQRATVNFKVFSIGQLDYYEKYFLVVGKDIEIEYGWTARSSGANKGKFKGITYNFSYNLNREGGFDCQIDAVGEGYYTLGVDPSKPTVTSPTLDSALDTVKFGVLNGIDERLRKQITDSFPNITDIPSTGNFINGIAALQVGTIKPVPNTEEGEDGTNNSQIQFYTTLGNLVNEVNNHIQTLTNSQNVKFVCDKTTTIGHKDWWIKSANPYKMIIPNPDQADYDMENGHSRVHSFVKDFYNKFVSDAAAKEAKAKKPTTSELLKGEVQLKLNADIDNTIVDSEKPLCDLSMLLINVNFLIHIQAKSKSMADFFNRLFAEISEMTGEIYDLTMFLHDYDSNKKSLQNEVWIVNKNYTTAGKTINPVKFRPFGVNSIVRDMNLSAQIPTEMATEAYVAERGGKKSASKYPRFVANAMTNQKVASIVFTDPNGVAQTYFNLYSNFRNIIASQDTVEILTQYNPTVSLQTTLGSTLNQYKATSDDDGTKWNENIMLPLNLSVTIDGIDGFKFGDTITTTYLPSKYKTKQGGFKALFTVTKVNHTISNNDWTTQLETVCRLTVQD